ncbi:MAG: insulinase family protein [Gammaproteobacteria bacterium]|nr:insulinase family protein [Gammaproteobacteria bacterium]MBL6999589.1 insulinase family protein [Gammaproteobacteria bacterium]
MKKNLILLIILLMALPLQAKTVETVLDNGMKIIVREDHRAPVVASQVWYRIGSNYEYDGITGVSHVLEHMMFKGTKSLKPGEFSEIIAANGGTDNAFTFHDFTGYHQKIASDRLEICLKLEADRMRNVIFLQQEFDKEVAVVREERRMRVDNKPRSQLFEQFYATAFLSSPKRIPVIGWMGDLENMEMQDAADWYKLWYAPNNATLVVVGDVQSDEVIRLAKKYFSELKPSIIKPPKLRPEIPQMGERRINLVGQTASPYLIMGYKTPVLTADKESIKDVYALDVLGAILDGGNSARIARNMLRGDEIAVEAGTSYDPFDRLAGLFLFAGTPNKGVSPEQLEKAFIKEIKELQTSPVSVQELARVKAQVIASKVFERDSMFYTGMQIGMLDSAGHDWRLMDHYVDDIRNITAADIQRVAKQYFDPDQLTVATLWPQQDSK